MRKGTATVSDRFYRCINVCLSFYHQQSTMKFRGKATNRSCLVTTWSTPPFIQWRPQKDTAIFYYSLNYHNTQAGPAPLWAWPTLRSTEAFHFWKQKIKKKHHVTLYPVLVRLVYLSFLSSGISSTKSDKVNCQSYTWTFSSVEIIPSKTLICLHMTTLHVSWSSLSSLQLNI